MKLTNQNTPNQNTTNHKIVVVSIIALSIAVVVFLVFNRAPEFPDSIPSSDQTDIRTENYKAQLDFFDKYTRYIRDNHGGILLAEEINKNVSVSGKNGYSFTVFRHRYKFFNKSLVFDLTNRFSQREKAGFNIKTAAPDRKPNGLSDYYEIEFLSQKKTWIRVQVEIVEDYKSNGNNGLENGNAKTEVNGNLISPSDEIRLVVIVDDLGNRMDVFNKLILLDFDITYSVMPQLAYSQETAEIVYRAGREVMLHQPMQPKEWPKFNPGTGALLLQDDFDTIIGKMEKNLQSVPYAVGVNNHMGSAYTQYADGLDTVMKVLNERALFFLDSKTAPGRIAKRSAQRYLVPYLSRDIFLDNNTNEPDTKEQLFKAVRIAKRRGWVIVICHPYPTTYQVLAENLPVLEEQGIKVTRVSDLLN
ncbi:MAG: divergent polysaccharide deacetylase family protein [Proteobacteria bacterium]|nr:divergent polysaccharide deacetylase family protein [Pseudomonadota bacterium]